MILSGGAKGGNYPQATPSLKKTIKFKKASIEIELIFKQFQGLSFIFTTISFDSPFKLARTIFSELKTHVTGLLQAMEDEGF